MRVAGRIEIPLAVPSCANLREHWAKKAKRTTDQRTAVRFAIRAHIDGMPRELPLTVTLTRMSQRFLDDDNLAHAFKAIRDGVADALGVSDAPGSGVAWRYEQEKSKTACVRIEVAREV